MSTVSSDDVKKLARLSALELSDDEVSAMRTDLTQILSYVEQLGSAETSGVEPTYYTHKLQTVTRPDEVIDYGVDRDGLLKNAAMTKEGAVVVPRVLE